MSLDREHLRLACFNAVKDYTCADGSEPHSPVAKLLQGRRPLNFDEQLGAADRLFRWCLKSGEPS